MHIPSFLLGTEKIRPGVYTIIQQYNELLSANKITSGPIQRMHDSYMREKAKAKMEWTRGRNKVKAMLSFAHAKKKPSNGKARRKAVPMGQSPGGTRRPLNVNISDSDDESDGGEKK